jgi:hypothetical protein
MGQIPYWNILKLVVNLPMNDKGFGNSDSLQVKIAREIRDKNRKTL